MVVVAVPQPGSVEDADRMGLAPDEQCANRPLTLEVLDHGRQRIGGRRQRAPAQHQLGHGAVRGGQPQPLLVQVGRHGAVTVGEAVDPALQPGRIDPDEPIG